MDRSTEAFWSHCLTQFALKIPEQQLGTWLRPLICYHDENTVHLIAPNQFTLQFVRDRYLPILTNFAQEYFSKNHKVEIKVSSKKDSQLSNNSSSFNLNTQQSDQKKSSQIKSNSLHNTSHLKPSLTFDSLVIGKGNHLAQAAALQIAENIGQPTYNPFFLHGATGLGKTHMIHAIGNAIQKRNNQAKVRYIQSTTYVQDLVKATRYKSWEEFQRYYYSLDVLIIDDIQFFTLKTGSQEEFFNAYNALMANQKQIIITSDRYPKDIPGMDERLVSRFGWGLTVAIEPPEFEMRAAILDKKAAAVGAQLDRDVTYFIAKHVKANVRELEGALNKVLAYSRFNNNSSITIESTRLALKDMLRSTNENINIEMIQKTVSDYFKIKTHELTSKKRTREITRPRQMAMMLARELTQTSLAEIGEAFGNRDHTTVLHACNTMTELRRHDQSINHSYNILIETLRP